MILVADDDPSIRRVMLHLLGREGFSVLEAADGEAALALAREHAPPLCLLDVMMPKLDGVALCAALRAEPAMAGATIVMVSAMGEEQVMLRAFEAGADDYVVKPFSPGVLLHKVRSWMRQKRTVKLLRSVLDLEPGCLFDERYRIGERIGRGGMAVVYRAQRTDSEEPVALKIFHGLEDAASGDTVRRFRREVSALSLIAHPNVVRLLDAGWYAGYYYYVMELIEGESARGLLLREAPLPVERALKLTLDVACGLAAAHDAGFLHRDIKLANMFVDGYGRAKLGDFGIALPIDPETGDRITSASVVVGTLDCLSPEQIRKEALAPPSDIYSLGLALYQLLTGKLPYEDSSHEEYLALTLRQELPPPSAVRPGLPEAIDTLVGRACATDPTRRFQTARELVEALRQALGTANPPDAQ